MAFLTINERAINSEQVGRVVPDEDNFSITYEFLGGRVEVEYFDSLEAMSSKLQQIIEL